MTDPTLVLGGGISGLAAAIRLADAGQDVRVLECAERPGGLVESERLGEFLVEWGPNSFLAPAPAFTSLVERAGVSGEIVAASDAARHRYIFAAGRLHRVPHGPGSFLASSLVSSGAKLRILCEVLLRRGGRTEESVAEFFRRRFGAECVERFVAPFVTGIYAGSPEELEMESTFPEVAALERQAGSVLRGVIRGRTRSAAGAVRRGGSLALRGGLAQIAVAAARTLGASLQLGTRVTAIAREGGRWRVTVIGASGTRTLDAPRLIVALPAHRAAPLLAPVSVEMGRLLAGIPYSNIAVAHIACDRAALARPLDGFGFLVARGEPLPIAGCIWASAAFPHRAPPGRELLSVFLGGRAQEEVFRRSDDDLWLLAREGVARALGGGLALEPLRMRRIANAIPQYVVGHGARIARLRASAAALGGLWFAGNHLDGVSVERAVASGFAAATLALESGGT